MKPAALLIDFGGVLTTDVFESFAAFCETEGIPPDTVRQCLANDERSRQLLVALESGQISEADFDRAFATRLSAASGVEVVPAELVARLTCGLRPVPEMVEAMASLRAVGIPTVLVSNTLGEYAYEWCDLDALFDAVVLSGVVGVRKPSRRIYAIAAELAGAHPCACVLVDDLEINLAGAKRIGVRGIHHTEPTATIAKLGRVFSTPLAV